MLPNTLVYPNMFKCFMKSKYYYTYVNKDIIHILALGKAEQLHGKAICKSIKERPIYEASLAYIYILFIMHNGIRLIFCKAVPL